MFRDVLIASVTYSRHFPYISSYRGLQGVALEAVAKWVIALVACFACQFLHG